MKIITSINAANTNLSAMKKNGLNAAVIKGNLNIGNENNLEKKDKGNFDKAEAADIDRMKLKLTRDLSDLSADEKAEAAFNSYMSMQRSCREAIGSLELKEYCFTNLKEQKAYYLDLLENDGKISESGGKYEFFGEKDGTYVNKDDIAKALSKVQGHINNYLAEPDEKNDVTNFPKMVFKQSAAIFSAATGITDKALSLEDDSMDKVKSGLTEENYLEKTNNDINSLKDRAKEITNIMVDYASRNKLVRERMDDPFKPVDEDDKNPHLSKVIEEYRKYLESSQLLI